MLIICCKSTILIEMTLLSSLSGTDCCRLPSCKYSKRVWTKWL